MSFTLEGLNTASNFIAKIFKGVSVLLSILLYCVASYIGVWVDALRFIVSKLSTVDPSDIGTVNFATVDGIAYVNAVFPLSEVVGIYTIYFTSWGIICLVRWTKSFIPALSN